MEPLNNGHVGDECFVHCSEVVHSSEVEMYGPIYSRRVNSLSIVGRLSTPKSVHHRRFHCTRAACMYECVGKIMATL